MTLYEREKNLLYWYNLILANCIEKFTNSHELAENIPLEPVTILRKSQALVDLGYMVMVKKRYGNYSQQSFYFKAKVLEFPLDKFIELMRNKRKVPVRSAEPKKPASPAPKAPTLADRVFVFNPDNYRAAYKKQSALYREERKSDRVSVSGSTLSEAV